MNIFNCFVPHPPILIPGIGKKNDLERAKSTIGAMKKLALDFAKSEPDLVITISPHGMLDPTIFTVGYAKKVYGDVSNFGSDYSLELSGDADLALKIVNISKQNDLSAEIIDHQNSTYFMDHGILVPLYYLMQELDYKPAIIPVGYSGASRSAHFTFGQTIADVIQKSGKRIAVVASGDMSHNLIAEQNSGLESGKMFDKTIRENIENFNPSAILNIDEETQEEAGECGYRSLLILLGILDGKKVKSSLLSYEAPWGVGYLVAKFDI
jgi:aromatic ring-opening dioxygenase LigB subunit